MQIRESYGLAADAPVVIFVGRVVPGKRIETLVEALAKPTLSSVHLLVTGEVDEAYKKFFLSGTSKSLRGRLHFTGKVAFDELPAYFSAADVGVWPGDIAISVIDAMSCGLPIVLPDCESASHFSSAGNGITYSPGDSEDLVRALHDILSDADKLANMSKIARSRAEQTFEWDQVAARTLAVYDDVLAERPSVVPSIW